MNVLRESDRLLEHTLNGNASQAAAGLDKAHTQVSSILTYNDENSLACAIGLAYYCARKDYRLIREFPSGKGFADIVFLPLPHTLKPAIILELKYGSSADAAIRQIKSRQYIQGLEGYGREILLAGVNYDKHNAEKPHSCVIEKIKQAPL